MSRMYSAGQFEFNYPPHHLGNWQAQDSQQIQQPPSAKDTHTQQWQATGFIVDDRGHMLPGVRRIKNSFRTRLPASATSPCRWPKPSPVVRSSPAATMGYKGIATSYLPRNHTVVKAVEAKGATEAKYT
eukprot:GHRQ01033585.1.p1 GENE.GHRQ01033585.1~~GHRQ01033585.1.p1  ORF type:complete len:129 (+),score=25.68 GHRQ01033585.1:398-784(+)